VKASVALPERHREVNAYGDPTAGFISAETEERLRRLRQLAPQRFWFGTGGLATATPRVDILRGFPQFNLFEEELEDMKRTLAPGQLRFALPDVTAADFKEAYHSITHSSYGVLASTSSAGAHRGLKRDLSSTATVVPDTLREFLDARPMNLSTDTFEMVGLDTDPDEFADGDPVVTIGPIISEVSFRYNVRQALPAEAEEVGTMMIDIEAEIEIWNPYSVNLSIAPMVVLMRNLPIIEIEHSHGPGEEPKRIDLELSFANFAPIIIPNTLIEAGRVEHLDVFSVSVVARDDEGEPIIYSPPETVPVPPALISLSAAAADEVIVELRLFDADPEDMVGEEEIIVGDLLGRFDLGPEKIFLEFDVEGYAADDDAMKFGFYMRLRDFYDEAEWLSLWDPRQIGLTEEGDVVPFEIVEDPTHADATEPLFNDEDNWPQVLVHERVVRLFELPLQDSLSIGALQHVQFHRRPAYSVGNRWGGVVNEYLDEFFFSTIPQATGTWARGGGAGVNAWDFPVPNTRLTPLIRVDDTGNQIPGGDDLVDEFSAEHLLLQGSFNINSTSVDAWRSVLGSLSIRADTSPARTADNRNLYRPDPSGNVDGDWRYAGGSFPLINAHLRFSQTGHLIDNYFFDLSDLEEENVSFSQGVRELTDDQVTDLAIEIVDRILANAQVPGGGPFLTLAEFAESGLLQDAIDAVPSINGSIPPYAAAFISQGDILTTMAPFMAARSDTFIVRAYGDAFNPATGRVTARAYCEAIVQRMPTPVDPNDPVLAANGRRFEIIYFRWMQPSDM
jgi:hypothetical protein